MPTFSYTAFRNGERITGTLQAGSLEQARLELSAAGLDVERLDLTAGMEPDNAAGLERPLSRDESLEVGGHVATVMQSGLPLVSGLQALYAEIPSGGLRRVLIWKRGHSGFDGARRGLRAMIERLEAGEPVERVIAAPRTGVAPQIPAIVRAGLRTGKLGLFLEQYLSRARDSADRRRQVVLGLAYPFLLLLAGVAILTAIGTWLVPQFKAIFGDFGVELPTLTMLVLSLSDLIAAAGFWVLAAALVVLLATWAGLPWFGDAAAWRRLVYRIPVIGDPWRFAALSEFSHLLALLTEGSEPLPDSLRVCGAASHNPDLARHARMLAEDIERGTGLAIAARSLSEFPPELVVFFHWAGDRDSFAEGLRAAGDIFDTRARSQIGVVAAVLEPLIILGVAGTIAMVLMALFLPLIKLLNELS